MKLFVASVAILATLCNAETDTESRNLRKNARGGKKRGNPGGKGDPDRIQAIIDGACGDDVDVPYDCGEDTAVTLEDFCTFERADRPDMSDWDWDTKKDYWAEAKEGRLEKKAEHQEKITKCGCCAKMTTEEIQAAQKQAMLDAKQAMLDAKCPTFVEENCPDGLPEEIDCTRYDSRNEGTRALGGRGGQGGRGGPKKNMLVCACCERNED